MHASGNAAGQVAVQKHAETILEGQWFQEGNTDFLGDPSLLTRVGRIWWSRWVVLKIKREAIEVAERNVVLRIEAELDAVLALRPAESVVLPGHVHIRAVNDGDLKGSFHCEGCVKPTAEVCQM